MGRGSAGLFAATLAVATLAFAAQLPPSQILGDLIKVNLDSTVEGEASTRTISPEWCYADHPDPVAQWWPFVDPLAVVPTAARVRNGFSIPYVHKPLTDQGPSFGAIIIGFDTGNASGTGAGQVIGSGGPCDIGVGIAMRAPFPILSVGAMRIDPASEYRWWQVGPDNIPVRFVQIIPVTYQVNGNSVPGRIMVGFRD